MNQWRIREKIKSRSRWEKIGLAMLLAVALYALIGFFALPPLFKMLLTDRLAEALDREVAIENIGVNPFVLSLTVENLTVKQETPPGNFVSLDELYINFQAVSLLKQAPVAKEVTLRGPHLEIIRTAPARFNFSDLLAGEETGEAIQQFSLNNIRITNGEILFRDLVEQEKQSITDLTLTIPFISNMEANIETWVEPRFSAVINGSPVSFEGESKPFTKFRKTALNIELHDIRLPRYFVYVPTDLGVDLRSGVLDLDLKFTYGGGREAQALTISGDLTLHKVEAVDRQGNPVLQMPKLELGIDSWAPGLRRLHLSRVLFHPLELHLRRNQDGRFNIGSPAGQEEESKEAAPSATEPPSPPYAFTLDALQVQDATIHFTDSTPKEPFRSTLKPLNLELRDYRNDPDSMATFAVIMESEKGESIEAKGEFSGSLQSSTGSLELSRILIGKYSPYFPDQIRLRAEKGRFGLKTGYRFSRGPQEGLVLSDLSSSLSGLRLTSDKAEEGLLELDSLQIRGGELDWGQRRLAIRKFLAAGGALEVIRTPEGRLNMAELFLSEAEEDVEEVAAEPAPEWDLRLDRATLRNFAVAFRDRTLPEPADLEIKQLELEVQNIASAEKSRGTMALSFRIEEEGQASATGDFGLQPTFADLQVELCQLPVTAAQPYLKERFQANLTGGRLSLAGDLLAGLTPEDEFTLSYVGRASLEDFSSARGGRDLLRVQQLAATGIDYSTSPASFNIREVALDEYYAFFRITPDGTVNLLDALRPPASGERTAESAGRAEEDSDFGPVEIGTTILKGGRIEFVDDHIDPAYSTELADLGGSIIGLSSVRGSEAAIELRGKMNEVAPLALTGKVNPLGEEFRLNLAIDLQGLDMANLDPFIRKYVGYTVAKGNLSLNVDYLIVQSKIDANHNILLDELTLGEQVPGEAAISVPIKLAIEILKNRQGEIKLDIPVSGDLDDPQFSLGSVVWSTIKEIITKAVTSPFSILASLVDWGGEELSYIEFPYGSSQLTEEAKTKLDNLARALYERPKLEMEISGYVAPEQDREALRNERLQMLLREQKRRTLAREGETGLALEEIDIGSDQYRKYLEMAFKAAKIRQGAKRPVLIRRGTPSEELRKFLLSTIEVTEEDLHLLAQQRAIGVRQYIVADDQIEPQRIFIVTPDSLSPPKKEGMKESRAVLGVE